MNNLLRIPINYNIIGKHGQIIFIHYQNHFKKTMISLKSLTDSQKMFNSIQLPISTKAIGKHEKIIFNPYIWR